MPTEITCRLADRRGEVGGFGGPGWAKDRATLIAELREGREYFVRVGIARVSVTVTGPDHNPGLDTDPAATPGNDLLSLPACPPVARPRRAERIEGG